MARVETADESDLQALERFVIENDDLLSLEEAIGRFNIFDALRIERAEIRHSNFLAWLLSPNESHGQGDLFLKAVLMDVLRRARAEGRTPPVSPVLLDGAELHDIEIRREWKNIDLLIISREPAFVVAIENKVDAGEHSNQLNRYEEIIRTEFTKVPSLLVFLSAHAQETEDEDWLDYSYRELHGVLTRVRRTSAGSLGADVGTFLDHYLSLIGSRFMNDTNIEELCRRIYSNHRRAIDLIVENAGTSTHEVLDPVRDALTKQNRWRFRTSGRNVLQFVPIEWIGSLSDADGRPTASSPCDLFVEIESWGGDPSNMSARLVVGPGRDPDKRLTVIDRFRTANPKLKMQRKKASPTWTRLGSKTLMKWPRDEELDHERAVRVACEFLEDIRETILKAQQLLGDLVDRAEAKP